MDRKTILVVNDDGIQAKGIKMLVAAARVLGDVWVVAPESQRSSMSHRIIYSDPITVEKFEPYIEGVHAYACSGTPADCVRVGIKVIGKKPDLVLSGINNGYNISGDIQYSATVGAALEAAFWGIPAISVSQADPDFTEVTERYLPELLKEYMDKPLSKTQVWNINFPDCKLTECKGIMRDCRVSYDNFYTDDYKEKIGDDGSITYTVIPGRNWVGIPGTDLFAVTNNYVSVGVVNNVG